MQYRSNILPRSASYVRLYTAIIDKEPAWFILHVDRAKMFCYERDVKSNRPINLPDYGTVLHRGWGSEPPAELVQQLHKELF